MGQVSPHPTDTLMSIDTVIPVVNNPEDVTPVPEDSDSLQIYIQDRRVIGVSFTSSLSRFVGTTLSGASTLRHCRHSCMLVYT